MTERRRPRPHPTGEDPWWDLFAAIVHAAVHDARAGDRRALAWLEETAPEVAVCLKREMQPKQGETTMQQATVLNEQIRRAREAKAEIDRQCELIDAAEQLSQLEEERRERFLAKMHECQVMVSEIGGDVEKLCQETQKAKARLQRALDELFAAVEATKPIDAERQRLIDRTKQATRLHRDAQQIMDQEPTGFEFSHYLHYVGLHQESRLSWWDELKVTNKELRDFLTVQRLPQYRLRNIR
jgi:hypothetical protein